MDTLNMTLAVAGGLVLVLGVFSRAIEKIFLSGPLLALLVGIAFGPHVAGIVGINDFGNPMIALEQASRITLAISLMGIALRLPPDYFNRQWRTALILVGLVMTAMWIASGAILYLVLGAPFWVSLLMGAVITPTDPVLASSIVVGDEAKANLPDRLRNGLSAESGANDGLGLLFVALSLLALEHSAGETLRRWLIDVLLHEIMLAVLAGALLGYVAGRALEWAEREHATPRVAFLAYSLALSLFTLGIVKLIGGDGILAVFVTGIFFNSCVKRREAQEEGDVQDAVNRFFILPVFILLGIALPWEEWIELGWQAVAIIVLILLVRRLPWLIAATALKWPLGNFRDAVFMGWFGPIGISAVFYATIALRESGDEQIWVVTSLVVAASVVIHGVTAVPFLRLYGRRTGHFKENPR